MVAGEAQLPSRWQGSPHLVAVFLYAASATVYFGALLSAYRVLGAKAGAYSPLELANLVVLLASGCSLFQAVRGPRERIFWPLFLTFLLGLLFVLGQALVWQGHLRSLELLHRRGAFFYQLFIASHGLHLTGGLCALGWLTWHKGKVQKQKLAAIAFYWGYVVLLWPLLFLVLYG